MGILEADSIKHDDMKEIVTKEYKEGTEDLEDKTKQWRSS